MQVRKIFLLLLSSTGLLCLSVTNLPAQNVVTNEKGEKIVIYPDGSWRYYEEGTNPDTLQLSPTAQSIQKEKEQLEKERTKDKKSKRSNKKNKDERVVNGKDTQLLQRAEAELKRAQQAVREIEDQITDVAFSRIFLEKELEDAHASGEATLDDLLLIEQRLKKARSEEAEVKENLSEAKKTEKKWSRIVKMSPEKREKVMADVDFSGNDQSRATSFNEEQAAGDDQAEASVRPDTRPARPLKPYDKSQDVRYNPPRIQQCEFTFDGVDEFSGKRRRELAPELFFTYTSDQLRPYFKEREYITCRANLTAVSGGLLYLTLEFTIASPNAQREFGLLEKGSPVSIKFIDGSTIKLINTKTDMGTPDPVNKTVTYQGQYSINSGAEKYLRKGEVDLVRVVWSQGYEDYEVYHLDFLANQFTCLD